MRAVVVGPAHVTQYRARVEVPSRGDVERIARMRGVPVLENESIWFCMVDGTMYVAMKRRGEADFWSWVASEKAKLDRVLEQAEEAPDLLTWLEQEINEAREAAFSAAARRENGAEYWTGYADALEDLLNAIRRREVRV